MSNLETRPAEVTAGPASGGPASGGPASGGPGAVVAGPAAAEVLRPREVPLGGPRAMTVRRTLPQRQRSLIGAWCFIDHYGPDQVVATGGMRVPPHPHTGLQTISWLLRGMVEHRDSAGNHALIRPGELNLMTAGRGISHSEVSTPDTPVLHGVQLWAALPSASRFAEPGFAQYVPPLVRADGLWARVFLGSLLGSSSPVATHSPLLGAEVSIDAGAVARIPVEVTHEHGVLVDGGPVALDGTPLSTGELGYLTPGRDAIELAAPGAAARVLILGGTPLGEQIVMWWNFVGRSHDEIAGFRADWQARIGAAPGGDRQRFDLPVGNTLPPLPAPPLPAVTLRPRQ
ncbi:MAG TPA: pirin family protein [Streptosporangiaceae bacterium]|nr:pirin family protein [Streptosporangiaceae bacterium]